MLPPSVMVFFVHCRGWSKSFTASWQHEMFFIIKVVSVHPSISKKVRKKVDVLGQQMEGRRHQCHMSTAQQFWSTVLLLVLYFRRFYSLTETFIACLCEEGTTTLNQYWSWIFSVVCCLCWIFLHYSLDWNRGSGIKAIPFWFWKLTLYIFHLTKKL